MAAGRYKLSRKLFSVGGDYTVKDGTGATVLSFDGKVRFAVTFSVQTPDGRELFTGREYVMSLDQKFDIERDGVLEATLLREIVSGHRKIFGTPNYRYVVSRRNGQTFEARGSFLSQWTLQRDGAIVARVDTDGHVSEIDLEAATDDGFFIFTVVMAIVRLNPQPRVGDSTD